MAKKPEIEYRIIALDGQVDEYDGVIFDTQASAQRTLSRAAAARPPFDELYVEQREVGPWERAPDTMQAEAWWMSQG